MKKVMRTLLAAGAFVVAGAVTAQAADITPVTGHWTKLGADYSALVYYIDEPDGFHVVVTTQQGRTSRAAVERFETVLAAGQSAAVSIPRGAGEAPARIVLSNAGDHLHIAEPIAAASVQ
jgi:ABC-type glycerol-3-phosphate transport system substrate-binding protein